MELAETLGRFRSAIEAELVEVLKGHTQPLYRMAEYQLGWCDEQGNPSPGHGGKRLRPVLCLLACEALGGDVAGAMPAAVAVELVHNFSLVHDDVQDGSPERHHRPSIWWIWGPAQAINAGDSMHALARLALFRLLERGMAPEKVIEATRLLDQASLELCEGQFMDISFQERVDVSMSTYLRMIEGKTGALMGCAMEMGALMACDEPGVRGAFRQAGCQLGMAFQVRDDMLDLWGRGMGKIAAADILNKKKSLPVVFAFERASLKEKRELGTLYLKRVLEPADVPRVVELLTSLGAREFCQEQADKYSQQAVALLEGTGVPKERLSGLHQIIQFAVTREM